VFLRVLEYYEGILFLTTNRVGTIDEAFKSRIHMPLYYPLLNYDQNLKIWRSQLRRIKEGAEKHIEFDEIALLDYAKRLFETQANSTGSPGEGPRWNGRQIRNAFQSAIAIAVYRTEDSEVAKLNVEHFWKVAKASNDFNDYLRKTKRGLSDGDIAGSNMTRTDKYGLQTSQSMMLQPQGYSQYNGSPQPVARARPTTSVTQHVFGGTYPGHEPFFDPILPTRGISATANEFAIIQCIRKPCKRLRHKLNAATVALPSGFNIAKFCSATTRVSTGRRDAPSAIRCN